MPTRPTDESHYLEAPNYYRLAYQLAAQRMHAYLTTIDHPIATSPLGETALDPAAEANANPDAEAAKHLKAARKQAYGLINDIKRMQDWFSARARQRWWHRDRQLTPRERRLNQFLSNTVLPSTRLLVAGIMVAEGNPKDAEREVAPIRAEVLNAKLSYRTAYNLACYEVAAAGASVANEQPASDAGRGGQGQLDPWHLKTALKALREALSGVHGRRRSELGRWARKDPALQALAKCSQTRQPTQASESTLASPQTGATRKTYAMRFDKLLHEYGIPSASSPSPSDKTALDAPSPPPAPTEPPQTGEELAES